MNPVFSLPVLDEADVVRLRDAFRASGSGRAKAIAHKAQAQPFAPSMRAKIRQAAQERFGKPGQDIFGRRRRFYFRLAGKGGSTDATDLATSDLIRKLLWDKQRITVTDYIGGYAEDENGGKRRIGKVLRALGERKLLEKFRDDPMRQGETMMVLTNRPSDIAYMCTHRAYKTCLSRNGTHENLLPHEIAGGVLVCYLIRPSDPLILDPLARIRLIPYRHKDGDVKYRCGYSAGLTHAGFIKAAETVARDLSSKKPGLYRLDRRAYADGFPVFLNDNPDWRDIPATEILDHLDLPYKINGGFIDVAGDFNLDNMGITHLPDLSKIRMPNHDFYCCRNKLTSLEGAPSSVKGLRAHQNNLKSLAGAPGRFQTLYTGNKALGEFFHAGNIPAALLQKPAVTEPQPLAPHARAL